MAYETTTDTKNSILTPQAEKVIDCYDYSKEAFTKSIEYSEKAMRYVNNESWSDPDVSNATKYKNPTLKYNILIPILSTLQGNEQLNKKRAKIKPTDLNAVDVSDIIQGRWNALNDEQDIEEKIQIAFMDALITRMGGWIQRDFKLTDEGYLDFNYEVINNMRIWLDPETRASDYMLNNTRWVVKEGWESLDVIQDKYGLSDEDYKSEQKLAWWKNLIDTFQRFKDKKYTSDQNYDKENDRYKVLEMQERVSRKLYRVFDGESYYNLTPPQLRELRKTGIDIQVLNELYDDRIHTTTIIPYFDNVVVLDEDSPSPVGNFDVFPIFSYNYNLQVSEQTSLVDLLIDIQDDVNKGKSQTRDYVTQLLSGGVFIDKREKEAIKQLRKRGNMPNQVYELNNMALMPQRIAPGQIPPDIFTNTENSVQYAQRVSLINEAMKGETGRSGESGVLFQKKIERAAAAINPYFKNVSNLRKAIAKDFVDHFSYVYAEEDRVIAVKNQQNVYQESIINLNMAGQTLNNVTNLSLRVELDEGEDNVTAKEEGFERMLALTNVISQVNPAFVDIRTLVASAPIPESDKMVEYIDSQMEAQSQAAGEQKQIEETKQNLENMKVQRGILNDEEKLRIEAQKVAKSGAKK